MKAFFLFCSGADLAILEECPTDKTKYAGIGATIFTTALLAAISGGYALYSVFQSIVVAILWGILWGAIIFNLDRVIVSGMRKQKSFKLDLIYAIPRLAVAVLLAVVISRPLELRLFAKEIRAEIELANVEAYGEIVQSVERGFARLKTLERKNEQLKKEIADKQKEVDQLFEASILEAEGRAGTRIRGKGPVFKEKEERRAEMKGQLEQLKKSNGALIQKNEEEIARLAEERQRQIDLSNQAQIAADGFLAQMNAFGRLKAANSTVLLASLFITLLFIALEAAPVFVKLLSTLSPYRPYDQKLEDREFQIVADSETMRRLTQHRVDTSVRRGISELDENLAAEIRLGSEKHRQRLDVELRANERLMQRIAETQTELAERIVEEWRKRELERIELDLDRYIAS